LRRSREDSPRPHVQPKLMGNRSTVPLSPNGIAATLRRLASWFCSASARMVDCGASTHSCWFPSGIPIRVAGATLVWRLYSSSGSITLTRSWKQSRDASPIVSCRCVKHSDEAFVSVFENYRVVRMPNLGVATDLRAALDQIRKKA